MNNLIEFNSIKLKKGSSLRHKYNVIHGKKNNKEYDIKDWKDILLYIDKSEKFYLKKFIKMMIDIYEYHLENFDLKSDEINIRENNIKLLVCVFDKCKKVELNNNKYPLFIDMEEIEFLYDKICLNMNCLENKKYYEAMDRIYGSLQMIKDEVLSLYTTGCFAHLY